MEPVYTFHCDFPLARFLDVTTNHVSVVLTREGKYEQTIDTADGGKYQQLDRSAVVRVSALLWFRTTERTGCPRRSPDNTPAIFISKSGALPAGMKKLDSIHILHGNF